MLIKLQSKGKRSSSVFYPTSCVDVQMTPLVSPNVFNLRKSPRSWDPNHNSFQVATHQLRNVASRPWSLLDLEPTGPGAGPLWQKPALYWGATGRSCVSSGRSAPVLTFGLVLWSKRHQPTEIKTREHPDQTQHTRGSRVPPPSAHPPPPAIWKSATHPPKKQRQWKMM